TATCEDLREKISRKEFREDLYFRITGFQFHLKSLAERKNDIELLIKHFQKKSSRRFVIRADAMELLKEYSWPGNIRELFKTCERLSQTQNGIIDRQCVQDQLKSSSPLPFTEGWQDYVLQHGLRSYINNIEKKAVEESMKRNNGKITACIKELKISSSAFYRILQEHHLH